MRRALARFTALACLAGATVPAGTNAAQMTTHRPAPPAAQQSQPGQPPHAWLFGTWTGGLFPAPSTMTAEACLSQPVVIFTRDVVLRATLIDQLYIQRLISTALTSTGGTQFHFASLAAPGGGLLGAATAVQGGFGCGDPDTLTVVRQSDNEITFPNCADFPNPLVRCPSR